MSMLFRRVRSEGRRILRSGSQRLFRSVSLPWRRRRNQVLLDSLRYHNVLWCCCAPVFRGTSPVLKQRNICLLMDAVKQCKVLVVVRKPDKPLNIQLYFTMLLHQSTHDLSARLSVIVSALVGNRSFATSLALLTLGSLSSSPHSWYN